MSPRSARLGLWAAALLALAPAAPAARAGETVKVCILTIIATERDSKVDRKLECIAREVRAKHEKLTGFHCVGQMTCKALEVGVAGNFDLLEKQVATITVQHGADEDDRVELKVVPPRMGEITYTTCCGKFFPIVTPFRTKNDDLLIIAIRVLPCHGDK